MKRWLALAFAGVLLAQPAVADIQFYAGGKTALLFQSTTVVGNGADTTEDTLYTATLPVGTFLNLGSAVHVVAKGTAAATTDSKTVRIRLGGLGTAAIAPVTLNAAGQVSWLVEAWIWKTGSNAQAAIAWMNNTGNNTVTQFQTTGVTDTAAISLLITGQNSTAATANSIQSSGAIVWSMPGQ